jgi:hypothetical protein
MDHGTISRGQLPGVHEHSTKFLHGNRLAMVHQEIASSYDGNRS